MKERIKVITSTIADLDNVLIGATGEMKKRFHEEILNAQFELKQLLTRRAKLILEVKRFSVA
jgi:hypothetical protein